MSQELETGRRGALRGRFFLFSAILRIFRIRVGSPVRRARAGGHPGAEPVDCGITGFPPARE